MGAIYKNEALNASASIIGTTLQLEVDTRDITAIRAYLPDGSSIGLLRAQGRWALKPHSLKTRDIVNKLIQQNIIAPKSPDPIAAYHRYKYQQSRQSAKATSALVKSLKESGDMIVVQSNDQHVEKLNKAQSHWQPRKKQWITLKNTKRR